MLCAVCFYFFVKRASRRQGLTSFQFKVFRKEHTHDGFMTCLLQSRALSDEMKLTFAAANKTFCDNAEVRQIDVPSFSGSFGILAKHVPTLAVLKLGDVLVFGKDGKSTKFYASSGSITVNKNTCVLAEVANKVEDIDISEVKHLFLFLLVLFELCKIT